jgi:hypothetical protein
MAVIRIQYDNGYYIGEVIGSEGLPVEDGRGQFFWSNGDHYEGEFLGGERTGKGIFRWASGDSYEGDFLADTRTGKGIFRWVCGDSYEGEFLNGARTGKGIIIWANGERYEGEFLDGHMEGTGTHYSNDGNVIYDGEWIESCPINKIADG